MSAHYEQDFVGGDKPFSLVICAHIGAPTFTFDTYYVGDAMTLHDGRLMFCRNVTIPEMEQHIAACQAALEEAMDRHGPLPTPRAGDER